MNPFLTPSIMKQLLTFTTAFLASALVHAAPPNILFIFSDDHAQHAISAYGSKVNQTPHLDRIERWHAFY